MANPFDAILGTEAPEAVGVPPDRMGELAAVQDRLNAQGNQEYIPTGIPEFDNPPPDPFGAILEGGGMDPPDPFTQILGATPLDIVDDEATLWDQVKAGFNDFGASADLKQAMALEARRKKLEEEEDLQVRQQNAELLQFTKDMKREAVASMVTNIAQGEAVPPSKEMQAFTRNIDNAQGVMETLGVLGDVSPSLVAEVVARNAPNVLVSLISAIVTRSVGGGGIGKIGHGFIQGGTSAAIDYQIELVGALKSEGVDTTDEASVLQALSDPKLISRIKDRKLKHAAGVGLLDGLTSGLAGKVIAPASLAAKPIRREGTNLAAQTGIDVLGEASGETLGQVLEGEGISKSDIAVEALGGFASGPTNIAGATIAGVRDTRRGGVEGVTPETPAEPIETLITETVVQDQVLEGQFVSLPPAYHEANATRKRADAVFAKLNAELPKQNLEQSVYGEQFLKDPLTKEGRRNDLTYIGTGTTTPPEGEAALQADRLISDALLSSPDPTRPGQMVDPAQTLGQPHQVTLAGFSGLEGLENLTPVEAMENLAGKLMLDFKTVNSIDFQNEVTAAEQQTAKVAKDFISRLSRQFLTPETQIILSDGTFDKRFGERVGYLGGFPGEQHGYSQLLDKDRAEIAINTQTFLPLFLGPKYVSPARAQELQIQFNNTLAHEFGHTLMGLEIGKAPLEVQNALYADYEKFLASLSDATPYEDFITSYYPSTQAGELVKLIEKYNKRVEDGELGSSLNPIHSFHDYLTEMNESPEYTLSFDEWVANNVVKAFETRPDLQSKTGQFFSKLAKVLETFYQKVVKKAVPAESINAFLDKISSQRDLLIFRESALKGIKEAGEKVPVEVRIQKLVRGSQQNGPPLPPSHFTTPAEPTPDDILGELDRYGKTIKFGATLTQLVKLNQHIPGVVHYAEETRNWWNTKLTWISRADERLKQWQQMSNEEGKRFANFLFEMTLKSDQMKRAHTIPEMLALAERYQLTDDMLSLLDGVQEDMSATLDALEAVLMQDAMRANPDNPIAQEQAVAKVSEEMAVLRNRDFFPLSRYGKFHVTMTALEPMVFEGERYKIGDTVSFEMFEAEGEKDARFKELKRDMGSRVQVSAGKLADDTYAFHGMPPQLIKKIEGMLTTEEDQRKIQEFRELVQQLSPAQSFKRHLLNRKGTAGFSQDAMRGYADYFSRFANHIARIQHFGNLRDGVSEVRDSSTMIRRRGGDSTKRDKIADHLDKHFNYILNPKFEFENLRAIGFMWYLGFLPKSAVINLSQVPLVTYPHLAAKYGDKAAVAELVRSFKTVKDIMLGKHNRIEPELREALSRAVTDGFIDESLATELAAVSEGGTLQRYTVGGVGPWAWSQNASVRTQKELRRFSSYGSYLFQSAEKMNRRATFVAAWRLAKNTGMDGNQAYRAARDSVESTQYEYAKWNRADFMRGRRSVIFLFWQYLQNTLFFAFGGDKGALRFWMMMAFMGGLQGLPFAENIMDMWNFAAKKLSKQLGWKHPEHDVQVEIRQLVQQLGVDPDLIMHGTSRYAFGWPQVKELGIDGFSGFDLSGSLSMGDIIPGLSAALSPGKTSDKFMSGATDLGGAVVSIPVAFIKAIGDDNPDVFKRWERAMPSALRSVSRAYRFAARGEETGRAGGTLAEFDMNDGLARAEVIGQALGFTPTRVAQRKEADWAVQQTVMYWETQRRLIMQDMFWAQVHKDKAAVEEAKTNWKQFNNSVPDKRLKIAPKDMQSSLKARARGKNAETKGLPRAKRFRHLTDEVRDAYLEELP